MITSGLWTHAEEMKFAIESYGGVRGVATIVVPCPLTTPDPNPNKHRSFVVPSLSALRHHGILLNYVIVVGNVSSGALVWRYTNKCTTNSVGNNYTSLVHQNWVCRSETAVSSC